jgi:hypothetical protein
LVSGKPYERGESGEDGGYAYRYAYLRFGFERERGVSAEKRLERFEEARQKLNASDRPSTYEILCAHAAVDAYNDWLTLNKALPLPGGTDDQPWDWVEQIQCCVHADGELDAKEQAKTARESKRGSGKVISAS